MCERDGPAGVLVCGGHPGQPGLHQPRKRVIRSGFTQGHRLRRREPGAPGQLASRIRLGFQVPPHRPGIAGFQSEPGREMAPMRKMALTVP
jgi:hypothetical protein